MKNQGTLFLLRMLCCSHATLLISMWMINVSQCTLGIGHDLHGFVVLPVTDHDLFLEIIAIILSYYVLVFIHPL